jgi:hypothetical protein
VEVKTWMDPPYIVNIAGLGDQRVTMEGEPTNTGFFFIDLYCIASYRKHILVL